MTKHLSKFDETVRELGASCGSIERNEVLYYLFILSEDNLAVDHAKFRLLNEEQSIKNKEEFSINVIEKFDRMEVAALTDLKGFCFLCKKK